MHMKRRVTDLGGSSAIGNESISEFEIYAEVCSQYSKCIKRKLDQLGCRYCKSFQGTNGISLVPLEIKKRNGNI